MKHYNEYGYGMNEGQYSEGSRMRHAQRHDMEAPRYGGEMPGARCNRCEPEARECWRCDGRRFDGPGAQPPRETRGMRRDGERDGYRDDRLDAFEDRPVRGPRGEFGPGHAPVRPDAPREGGWQGMRGGEAPRPDDRFDAHPHAPEGRRGRRDDRPGRWEDGGHGRGHGPRGGAEPRVRPGRRPAPMHDPRAIDDCAELIHDCDRFLSFRIGVKRGRDGVLQALLDLPELTQRDLQARLGIQAGSLSELVLRLEEHGLVERVRDDYDHRSVRVRLTARGYEEARRVAYAGKADPFEVLDAAEREQLTQLLKKLAGAWHDRYGDMSNSRRERAHRPHPAMNAATVGAPDGDGLTDATASDTDVTYAPGVEVERQQNGHAIVINDNSESDD